MDSDEASSKWLKAFYNREVTRFTVYLDGFGELFVRRIKDGMVIGYRDKNKHFGIDDHVTIFFDEHGVKDIHRTIGDKSIIVFMKYNIDYFNSPDGIGKLLRDAQEQEGISLGTKVVFMLAYWLLNRVFEGGLNTKIIKGLSDQEAQELGTESPCLYVKAGYAERILLLPIYKIAIQLVSGAFMYRFNRRPTDGFKEQKHMGIHITKRQKRNGKK
jgi:hypothetical protein